MKIVIEFKHLQKPSIEKAGEFMVFEILDENITFEDIINSIRLNYEIIKNANRISFTIKKKNV